MNSIFELNKNLRERINLLKNYFLSLNPIEKKKVISQHEKQINFY